MKDFQDSLNNNDNNDNSNTNVIFQAIERKWTEKENQFISDIKNLTNNQYMVITVKNGALRETKVFSRYVGYCTFGLSLFFTQPILIVEGARSPENVRCLKRLQNKTSYHIEDQLKV